MRQIPVASDSRHLGQSPLFLRTGAPGFDSSTRFVAIYAARVLPLQGSENEYAIYI